MDAIDIKILNCLKTNSRQNASAISEQINLSVSAVIERIRKMESNGIIKQYTVVLNSAQTGNDMSAFISVSIEHPKYHQNFMDKVTGMPNIRECYHITGEFDYLLKLEAGSTAQLELVLNSVKSIDGVSQTHTLVVLSTVKNEISGMPLLMQNLKGFK